MITVVKHGNTTRTLVCPDCGCIFTCHKVDIFSYDGVKEARCPECDKCVTVEEN